jgi:hypothetical protein
MSSSASTFSRHSVLHLRRLIFVVWIDRSMHLHLQLVLDPRDRAPPEQSPMVAMHSVIQKCVILSPALQTCLEESDVEKKITKYIRGPTHDCSSHILLVGASSCNDRPADGASADLPTGLLRSAEPVAVAGGGSRLGPAALCSLDGGSASETPQIFSGGGT